MIVVEEPVFENPQEEETPVVNKREAKIITDYQSDIIPARPPTSTHSANLIVIGPIVPKSVKVNTLTPREQEKADEPISKAIHYLFNNQFMKAKKLLEQQATTDPLHALGLGSMVFLKALMTTDKQTTNEALQVLMSTYNLATAQIDNATKKNVGDTVIQYFASYCNYIKFSRGTGVPTHVTPAKPKALEMHKVHTVPNGVLRAHVAKAEACLQMAILHLLKESVSGYIKCGLNLKRAYASYSIVWQEYKRMGQLHNEYIDRDTISGIQFGIGSVHLVLASLPQKVLRIVAAFGWKADKHLGFALLKLCLEDRRARSPMASLMLLAYYTALTALCPQILSDEYTQPAIETLLDAQRTYPNSTIFLYFAGRTSRLARNLTLSTQSFLYAIETSKNEWAEVQVLHMCNYEMGLNHMMQNNWEEACEIFQFLYTERYWSQAIFQYLCGACLDMMGQRTEAILAFAEVPLLLKKSSQSNASTYSIEQYVLCKVKLFQSSGYQDMDMTMCGLEFLYLYNAYEFMDMVQLEQNLGLTDYALTRILESEKLEYGIRTRELLPETPPPQYDDQRGALLLIKASILNAMGRFQESVIHLNWIIDRKDRITADKWVVPYAYWEVGMTCWSLNQKSRGREFWEIALGYSNYDFEYRLAMRVNLAITRADELGIYKPGVKKTPSELYIPYNNTASISSMDDDDYTPMSSKISEQDQKVEEMEHVVAQLDLGSSVIAPL
ncbi:uncharacterized protein EV154DRAFT_445205 [Mucor mucedo]|uniref:uncharacterized protein n=1 Tax=Mucor mucedo TaxID=29922 RepID=UPI00221E5900|nr:uncharacterized protein EV154DRAFT_445205 [Mucor mucedo]KAI7890009.1 hypothetical protein EV154DRAFT_445205 [Mucor mucedo]